MSGTEQVEDCPCCGYPMYQSFVFEAPSGARLVGCKTCFNELGGGQHD